MRFSEPNTNEFEPERGSVYSERCVGDQHYVCVVNPDQQNPERVRCFPVEIDVDEGRETHERICNGPNDWFKQIKEHMNERKNECNKG